MDFKSVNTLNIRLNSLSGNLLPMTNNNSEFSLIWKLYSGIIWLIFLTQVVLMILGIIFAPIEKTLQNSTVAILISIEASIIMPRLYLCRNLLKQLIQKLNDLLCVQNEVMEKTVKAILQPLQIPLKFYSIGCTTSVIIWSCASYIIVFKKKYFFYEDFRMPIAISRQPFSVEIYLLGNTLIFFGALCLFLKKLAMDVYMINLVLLITAQYRYITLKLVMLFQKDISLDKSNDYEKQSCSEVNLWAKREMNALCQHHNSLIYIMSMLKKVLPLNFSVIYITSVFRFCFLGIMLTETSSFLDQSIIVMYLFGAIAQLYMICFAVHQLLDATMEMTENAFHEEWYRFGSSLKSTFILMIMSNKLPCKLSTFEKFNLSLPSFMTILNQAYSVALLFSKMR